MSSATEEPSADPFTINLLVARFAAFEAKDGFTIATGSVLLVLPAFCNFLATPLRC